MLRVDLVLDCCRTAAKVVCYLCICSVHEVPERVSFRSVAVEADQPVRTPADDAKIKALVAQIRVDAVERSRTRRAAFLVAALTMERYF